MGSSWAVSSWFKADTSGAPARNVAIVGAAHTVNQFAAHAPPPPVSTADGQLAQACRRAAEQLAQRTPADFHVVVKAPFVVAGDLSRQALEAYYDETIVPAVQAMQARYFRSRPDEPITVLLFSGEKSYNHYAGALFGDSGVSIYGYYKPVERTLLVNIATGSGTLLHELTHALFAFEVRDPPDWLNEGLASLHEQCRFRTDARGPWIEGLVNWRLAGLQTVIRQRRLRSLESLIDDADFRSALVGTNYAQARYFCLYLQQRGVLESFVAEVCASHPRDPQGMAAVLRALNGKSWPEIDRDFQHWALALTE